MANAKETYLLHHKILEDSVLLAMPAHGTLTPLTLFVCTYVAKLGNLHCNFVDLTAQLCERPHGVLVAINSNYGHACQPTYEHLVKAPKVALARKTPLRGHVRKVQGDGTCFNSAVEPILKISHPGISDEKIYKLKCFPSTGETQIPGVICADLSDGRAVLHAFVEYLNELKVGDIDAATGERKVIEIVTEQPKMLNYKFRIIRSCPRLLINIRALADYMSVLERGHMMPAGWVLIDTPYPIRETKPPTDDVKVSFRFKADTRSPRINIFQEGKINILGAESIESAQRIYEFFVNLFETNWAALISLQPRKDAERAIQIISQNPRFQPLTDEEIARIIDDDITADPIDASSRCQSAPPRIAAASVAAIIADVDDWDIDDDDES
jgi:hypothetical protein